MYIIVSWNGAEDATVVIDTDGNNETFPTKESAREFAQENCAWRWKVIEVWGINMNVIKTWSDDKQMFLYTPIFCKELKDLTKPEIITIIRNLEKAIQ